jgi:hypothetical protein
MLPSTVLRQFGTELGIDTASRMLDPNFADPLSLDFRLKPEMMTGL